MSRRVAACSFCGALDCPRVTGACEVRLGWERPAYLCPRVKVKVHARSWGTEVEVIPPSYEEWAIKHGSADRRAVL